MRIALEQVNDRKVRRGFAIEHRGTFEHQPPLGAVGMDKLIGQTGLAHTRLANHRHHLAVACASSFESLL
jgi:hypothetical protein